jgi:hypothetical protein
MLNHEAARNSLASTCVKREPDSESQARKRLLTSHPNARESAGTAFAALQPLQTSRELGYSRHEFKKRVLKRDWPVPF